MVKSLINSIDKLSKTRVNTVFKVGAGDIYEKNRKKSLSPEQLKTRMIKERIYFFITPNRTKFRQQTLTKNGIEKMQLKSIKKNCKFKNELLFTNKI